MDNRTCLLPLGRVIDLYLHMPVWKGQEIAECKDLHYKMRCTPAFLNSRYKRRVFGVIETIYTRLTPVLVGLPQNELCIWKNVRATAASAETVCPWTFYWSLIRSVLFQTVCGCLHDDRHTIKIIPWCIVFRLAPAGLYSVRSWFQVVICVRKLTFNTSLIL